MFSFRATAVMAVLIAVGLGWTLAVHAQAAPAPLRAGFQDRFFIQSANGDHRLVLGCDTTFERTVFVRNAGSRPAENVILFRTQPSFQAVPT
jgi:hypothetical protein